MDPEEDDLDSPEREPLPRQLLPGRRRVGLPGSCLERTFFFWFFYLRKCRGRGSCFLISSGREGVDPKAFITSGWEVQRRLLGGENGS